MRGCPIVTPYRDGTLRHSLIKVSLTYLRRLEVPKLTEEDMPMI